MTPTAQDIDLICNLVNDLCGIYLDESKDYLIEGRLGKLLQSNSCESYSDFAKKVRIDRALQTEVIDAITTNETLWFRDSSPFEALKFKIFPELIDAKMKSAVPKKFRVWSAACSTGQEAYSIAMTFADTVADFESWDFQVVGTDVSPSAVNTAQQGLYSQLEVSRGLDQKHLSGYFLRQGTNYRVNEILQSRCDFQVRNLLKPLSDLGTFDVIFCRNVSIYFTRRDRDLMFKRLGKMLTPGGWLFTGSGESLADLGPNWSPKQHCRAICYQPNGCNGVATLR